MEEFLIESRSPSRALLGLSCAYLVLLLGGVFTPRLWGFHAWTYLPLPYVAGVLLVTALVTFFTIRTVSPKSPWVIFPILGWGFFWLVRDRTHLLGDGQLWLSVLTRDPVYHAHEPLAFLGLYGFSQVCEVMGVTAPSTQAEAYSVFLGGLGIAALFLLAKRVTPNHTAFTFLFLLCTATLQFGAGYVEAYPSLWILCLAYALAAQDALDGRQIAWASFLAGCAFGVHGLGIMLIPSLVFLLWRRTPLTWLRSAAVYAAPVGFAYGVLPELMPSSSGGHGDAGEGVLSLFRGIAFYSHGPGNWLLEQVNRWGLTAPLAAGALLWLAVRNPGALRHSPSVRFLGLLAIPFLIPGLVLDTEGSRGSALDWDTFAAGAPAVGLWAATAWLHRHPVNPSKWILAPVLGGCLAFLAVQMNAGAASRRIEDLAQSPTWSSSTRAMAWESMAQFHRTRNDTAAAIRAYQRSLDQGKENPRTLRNTIGLLSRTGRHREAADYYERLMKVGIHDSDTWGRYGLTLFEVGARDSSILALDQALRFDPGNGWVLRELARVLVSLPSTAQDTARAISLMRQAEAAGN